ncbi:hypothetical protein ABZY22_34300, partial [Streptomyces syringium]
MFAQLNGLLRQLLREKEGRDGETSACVIDAQSVKTSTSVPAAGQGIDAGKRQETEHRHRHARTPARRAGHRGERAGLHRRHP